MAKGMKTGGRKLGSRNKRSLLEEQRAWDLIEKATAEGITPLELMLREMRRLEREIKEGRGDPTADQQLLVAKVREMRELAKDAAPYVHPRLSSITSPQGAGPAEVYIRHFTEKV